MILSRSRSTILSREFYLISRKYFCRRRAAKVGVSRRVVPTEPLTAALDFMGLSGTSKRPQGTI
jgi:hypothetical protein